VGKITSKKFYHIINTSIAKMREAYFNVFFDVVDRNEALGLCANALLGETCKTIFFLNAHCFTVAQQNEYYHNALTTADIIFNDGIGIQLGSRFARVNFKENLNGTDLIPEIIRLGAEKGENIYLIGGLHNVAFKARTILEKRYENIRIVGACHGFFSSDEEQSIIDDINLQKADILIVGMGVPKQELWIKKIRDQLNTVKICIAGGAIIDFIAGNVKRAPQWMRARNLEWVYRLYLEPKRLWRRYLLGGAIFFYYIFLFLIKGREKNKSY
jgi:N-acetylglucosaminyldiphosphoundecaprenol N-acetyl-beta-D-mannosaminyltransferase